MRDTLSRDHERSFRLTEHWQGVLSPNSVRPYLGRQSQRGVYLTGILRHEWKVALKELA